MNSSIADVVYFFESRLYLPGTMQQLTLTGALQRSFFADDQRKRPSKNQQIDPLVIEGPLDCTRRMQQHVQTVVR